MSFRKDRRLLLCYISGLDLRYVKDRNCPFLSSALQAYPWARFTNLPSNELFPTLISGVDPTKHGVWGVKLRPLPLGSLATRLWRRLPDPLTTSVQGFLHLVSNSFDLAAIPPRRRLRFDITRTKYKRRNRRAEAMFHVGGASTVFDIVGGARSHYVFDSSYDPERNVLPRLCDDRHQLEVLELYSLDRYQQWNLDRPDVVSEFYGRIDHFLLRLQEKCARTGMDLAIVTDHGHEPIRGSIDLRSELAELSLGDTFTAFVEVSSARFWFHNEEARRLITRKLSTFNHATLLRHDDMHRFGVPLQDDSYGEVFLFLDPGYIFFPHDFHQGLANLWLGLSDPMQRSRLRDPRHKGNHGHLPHFDAEQGHFLLCSEDFEAVDGRGDILDVAPSILGVLGYDVPPGMTGRALLRLKGNA